MWRGGFRPNISVAPGVSAGLERLGWSEGRNVRIDTRFARANVDQHQALAKKLVALQPE